MIKWYCFFRYYIFKELKLIFFFIFIFLLSTSDLAVVSFNGNNKSVIIQEAEYKASWICAEEILNNTTVGYGDIPHFWIARLRLISQSDPVWLQYNIEYEDLMHNPPIFNPAGLLWISRLSITSNPTQITRFLTFQSKTSEGLSTNFLWLNSSLLSNISNILSFSVPYSEGFIHYSPWRVNQTKIYSIEEYVGCTEPWTPLLNFSSDNYTSKQVRFRAIARTTMINSILKCGFDLCYNKTTGLLESLDFEFVKAWNERGVTYENMVWGDIRLNDVNFTELNFSRNTIPIFEPVPFLITSALMVLVFRKWKKNSYPTHKRIT